MPRALTSLNRSLNRAAPSSIEYSVCTCRWAYGRFPSVEAVADADMNLPPPKARFAPPVRWRNASAARLTYDRQPGEDGRRRERADPGLITLTVPSAGGP